MNDYGSTLDMVCKVAEIDAKIGLGLETKLCEEMGELLTALMQTKTYRARERSNEGWDEVREECADVLTCLMVMLYRVGGEEEISDVNAIVDGKLRRTIERFEKGEPV